MYICVCTQRLIYTNIYKHLCTHTYIYICICAQRESFTHGKRKVHIEKETSSHAEKDRFTYEKTPVHIKKALCMCTRRDAFIHEKRPVRKRQREKFTNQKETEACERCVRRYSNIQTYIYIYMYI